MTAATETAPRVARGTLLDRYTGAIEDTDGDWSDIMSKLDEAICELYQAMTRREWTGMVDPTADNPDSDGSGIVTEEAHNALRDALIDAIDRRGLAR